MNQILSLTETQRLLLCNMAYMGMSFNDILSDFSKKHGLAKKETMANVLVLKKKGMVEEEYSFWGSNRKYVVSSDYLVKTLFYVLTENDKLIDKFVGKKGLGDDYNRKYLRFVKEMITANQKLRKKAICISYDTDKVPEFTEEQRTHAATVLKSLDLSYLHDDYEYKKDIIYHYLYSVVDNPLVLCALGCLDSSVVTKMFSVRQSDLGEEDPKRLLRVIDTFLALFPKENKRIDGAIGCVCCNVFYATGEWLFDKYPYSDNHFLPLAQGVRLAYQRDLPGALKSLQLAIKLRNRNVSTEEKGTFSGYLSNFLYMVILALEGSEASRKKMKQCLKKSSFTRYFANSPAEFLANYFMDDDQHKRAPLLRDCLLPKNIEDGFRGPTHLAYLIVRYLGLSHGELALPKDVSLNPDSYIPCMAIIRHEMMPYLSMSEEEKQHLTECFGGAPMLTSMRVKQPWELVLESLFDSEAAGGNAAGGKEVMARGVYVFKRYSETVEVREQKRLKSGAWGKGRLLSMSAYLNGEFEMDELDQSILMSAKPLYSFPRLHAIIPLLVGTTDRLYQDSYYDLEPVSVVEEKPFISIDKGKDGITIQTNVSKACLDRKVVYVFDEATMTLTYYPMDPKEQKYLQQLVALGTLPLEAEPLLQKVLPTISKKVEIHTDFIEGADNLKEETGSAVLCVRIVKQGQEFCATILAKPLADGKTYCAPGVGDKVIFDERDGERYKVKRKKKAEKDNYALLLEAVDYIDDGDKDNVLMLSPEEVIELMEYIHENPDVAYIEWPEGENMRLAVAQPGSWNISMKKKAGWFDLEGDVQIDDDTVMNIAELLDVVSESRSRFVRLSDDRYLAMTDSLRKQLQRLAALASTSRGKTKIPAVGAALLGEALSGELDIKHPKAIDDLRKKIRQSAKLQPAVPDTLNATLRDYQYDGFQWMVRLDSWGAGACLADDMGLGKTIQAISFMLDKSEDGALLIVAPASVVPNWRNELNRFAPSLNVVVLNTEPDRAAAIADADAGTVILTTYGLLNTQEEQLVEKEWGCICLDEAHTIKNRDTKTSAVCMKLQSKHRIILTGTPLQNHLGELWNLFQFINPGLLGTYEMFQKKFITPIEAGGNEERRQQLRRIIQPFMLRRTKQEVATELPDKEDIKLYVELSEDEMGVYEVIRRRAKDELEMLEQTGQKVNMNTLAEITRLRMAACAAQLAEKKWKGECSKLDAFASLVQDLNQNGHRALVFSQFTSFLGMAAKRLDDAGIPYFYLDGSTPMAKREKMVKDFQKGKNNVFLISLKAGGLGLNLTGANYVIHLDPWWNPAIEQQATDRAHRIGQKEKVTVYHLVSQNTIEEKILRLHEQKRDLADSLLDGTNNSHKITASQLLEMLSTK